MIINPYTAGLYRQTYTGYNRELRVVKSSKERLSFCSYTNQGYNSSKRPDQPPVII